MASWSQERLEFATRYQSQASISRATGIPQSTLSYVIRGERTLPSKYHTVLRNMYQRTAYSVLKDAGLSSTQARRFSWYSPTRIENVLSEVGNVVTKLVNSRYDQYEAYLKQTGQFKSEADTRQRLADSISEALSKSDLPEERLAVMEYRNTNEL